MSGAYYNEHDPNAAAWLRELIKAGIIAPGEVDERSIEDVAPNELAGFTQCHFFAGIGVWSYALRQAGWPDDRPVLTGSCPCQPFSAAGKGEGFSDERHLWPAFHHLIKQRKPPVVFGEQVASKAADNWIDLVHADLEAVGYAFGCIPFPSAGVGAPHIRDRNFWVSDSEYEQYEGACVSPEAFNKRLEDGRQQNLQDLAHPLGRLGNNNNTRLEGLWNGHQAESGRLGAVGSVAEAGESGGVGDADSEPTRRNAGSPYAAQIEHGEKYSDHHRSGNADASVGLPGPTNGLWRAADWLLCRDGKWRPVEPGTFPLVAGSSRGMVQGSNSGVPFDANKTGEARVMRLRGYGNAINAIAAQAFIETYLQR